MESTLPCGPPFACIDFCPKLLPLEQQLHRKLILPRRIRLAANANVACRCGKKTASAVRAWLSLRGEVRVPELFLNARNDAMTRTGFECILRKHVHTAETQRDTFRRSLVSRHPPEWNRTNRRRISRLWLSSVPVFGNCIGMRRHLAAENMDRSVERVG